MTRALASAAPRPPTGVIENSGLTDRFRRNTQPSGQVVLYVRNDAAAEAWVTVLVNGQPWNSSGFWGQNMGVGCYAMPGGSRLVLLDRSPEVAGAGVLRQLYVRGQEVEPPSLWITIGKDGSVQQGTGVPAWSGAPQTC